LGRILVSHQSLIRILIHAQILVLFLVLVLVFLYG
jgi:hypothetical protein